VFGADMTQTEAKELGNPALSFVYGDKNESLLTKEGAVAISLCNPINSASDLGTGLAESMREGIPSIPGIQSWRRRTEILKAAGSEYLNYIFGWAPLVKEVNDVVDATRHHRDIMKQYHHGEGRNTHREFHFPTKREQRDTVVTKEWPLASSAQLSTSYVNIGLGAPGRQVSRVTETKRWFEGCFTYALPSSTDSWRKAYGFGSQADQLYGLTLTPDILWELVPWSWAVDWFSNAGQVINNVTNFGLAGLVMRYGYIMEETSDIYTVSGGPCAFNVEKNGIKGSQDSGAWRRVTEVVTKRRLPANPFGFGIGWEGLSPTQLAITAALGITRLL